MKLKLKNTPEQVELVKAMGSKDPSTAREAQEAFAAFLGPVIQKVLLTAGTASNIFVDSQFDEDDSPSYPLDLYYGEGEGYVTVWSQHMAGGLPTSQVEGMKEVKIATYRLDSAVSFNKRYARRARLDVISKAIERMANEVLIKQERNAWAVVMKSLADAETNSLKHVARATTTGDFVLADLNKMMTLNKRLNESYSGNTPIAPYSNGITDLYVSPEIMEKVRAFAYNPINTTGASQDFDQTLSDNIREDIYRNAGMQSIYGVNLIELVEFGASKKYNKLFGELAVTSATDNLEAITDDVDSNTGGSQAWDVDTHQILVGIDNSRGAFIRPVARQHDSGGDGTFRALPDEQFNMYGSRVEKTGFYGFLEEGRICIDARAILGLIV
tara:strand:+ start:22894 stop:24048 length:1155 start_codon:yes stop_codon:yes gene_type:complete